MNLHEAESQGYRLNLEQNQLAVYGPDHLLTESKLARLRQHRDSLIREVAVRDFCKLVQAYSAVHGCILDQCNVEAELDNADIEELLRVDTVAKQGWAEMLAYRLTKQMRETS